MEYFLKIINHEYFINKLWFNFYNTKIDIKNIILDKVDKIPEYCNTMHKIIIKENINKCIHSEIYNNDIKLILGNINKYNYLIIYDKYITIINIPEITLTIFECLSIKKYGDIIKNNLKNISKIIEHEYLVNRVKFYDSKIDIKNIILNNINKIPEYCNTMHKIIIKENTVSKLENIDNCIHLEIYGNNTISKLENTNKCEYLKICGNNKILKLENINKCKYLHISSK